MKTPEEREAVRLRLAELEKAGGGVLTPSAVVRDAKRKDSPLHAHFEWDVKRAAERYWLDQARALIVSVKVEVRTETRIVQAVYYSRHPGIDQQQQGYIGLARLRSDADLARESLLAEFAQVANLLRRARERAAVLNASHEVDQLLQGVVGLRARFEQQTPSQQQ